MKKEVDARGRACPEPVVLTKKALETADEITVIVDNSTAEENVRRFAVSRKCTVQVERQGGESRLLIKKPLHGGDSSGARKAEIPGHAQDEALRQAASGPLVLVIASDRMGAGNDELGMVLMRSFLHTLGEAEQSPDTMIFFNTGVRLAVQGSEVLDDLRALCNKGVRMLVCGTCLGFFEMKDKLAVGQVSNMYDITETMLGAGKVIRL
jgi:selenium metabolism protein YedF